MITERIAWVIALSALAAATGAGFFAGHKVQGWAKDKVIADLRAEGESLRSTHAIELANAFDKAAQDSAKLQQEKDHAVQKATQRATRNATAAASARDELDRLRDDLAFANAAAASQQAVPAHPACTAVDTGATARELLAACAGEVESLARAADAHASDARLLFDAWPKASEVN